MNRGATVVVLAATMSVIGVARAAAAPAVDLGAQLDALVTPHFQADQPGAAVLVRKGDQILLRKGYGLADVERGLPMRPELVFRLGSITKQLTAAAIMILADQGKLTVSDDIRKYLPDYPTHGATITIEHLLTHTSGIPSYTDQPNFVQRMGEDVEPAALLDRFKDLPLEFKPGERMAYSNSGYHLLGLIIEKASGLSYADFVAQRIYKVLGMTHSGYGDDDRLARVRGYDRGKGGPARPARYINMKIPYSAGALVSSVDDLATWDAAISAGKLLKPQSWQRVFTAPKLKDGRTSDYAYGWLVGKIDGRRAQRHGGGIPGFSTVILRMPDDGLLVTILMNSIPGPTDVGMLAHRLALTALGKPLVDPKVVHIDPALLDRYSGVYQVPGAHKVVVRREGDHLTVKSPKGPLQEAWPESDRRFFVKDWPVRFAFTSNDAGAVSALAITLPSGKVEQAVRTGEKVPPARQVISAAPDYLERFVGEYRLAPTFAIAITREGKQLFAQATDQPRFELFPSAPNEFFLKEVDAQLVFSRKGDQPAHELVLHQNGKRMAGKRVK
jgi:D-alanyl-D-alanine carboxypeptidase